MNQMQQYFMCCLYVLNLIRQKPLTSICDTLANSMGQRPSWEADSWSISSEITCLLWNSKFCYWDHKIVPMNFILSQLIPIHPIIFPRLQLHTYFTFHSKTQGSNLLIILDFIILRTLVRSPIMRLLITYFDPHTRYFLFFRFKL